MIPSRRWTNRAVPTRVGKGRFPPKTLRPVKYPTNTCRLTRFSLPTKVSAIPGQRSLVKLPAHHERRKNAIREDLRDRRGATDPLRQRGHLQSHFLRRAGEGLAQRRRHQRKGRPER